MEAARFGIVGLAPPRLTGRAVVVGTAVRPAISQPSVIQPGVIQPGVIQPGVIQPGVIFKQKASPTERTANPLKPYFLVHVRDDGTVRHTFGQAKQTLVLFSAVARGRDTVLRKLVEAFDRKTEQGGRMDRFEHLVASAIGSIVQGSRRRTLAGLAGSRTGVISKRSEQLRDGSDLELVTWLMREAADDGQGQRSAHQRCNVYPTSCYADITIGALGARLPVRYGGCARAARAARAGRQSAGGGAVVASPLGLTRHEREGSA